MLPDLRSANRNRLLCAAPHSEFGLEAKHELDREWVKQKFGSLEKFRETVESFEGGAFVLFDHKGEVFAATKPYREMLAKESA